MPFAVAVAIRLLGANTVIVFMIEIAFNASVLSIIKVIISNCNSKCFMIYLC